MQACQAERPAMHANMSKILVDTRKTDNSFYFYALFTHYPDCSWFLPTYSGQQVLTAVELSCHLVGAPQMPLEGAGPRP